MESNFEKRFGNREVGFLIRKFEERDDRNTLISTIKNSFKENGLKIVDALEFELHNEVWSNIKEYMDYCSFVVVVIDNFSPYGNNEFNPNTFLEIGYLLALNKPILILIQNSLESKIPTDFKAFIYKTFDNLDIDSFVLKDKIYKWIKEFKSKRGYLTVYFKRDYASLNFLSEFKDLIFSISGCEVISDKTISVNSKILKENDINYSNGVFRNLFTTCTLDMAQNFEEDFNNNRYIYANRINDAILKVIASEFPDDLVEDSENPGISYPLNNDTEELVYCTRASINGVEKEIGYAKSFFQIKETLKREEIEVTILKTSNLQREFVYVTNYKRALNLHPLKMLHARKDGLPCVPLDLIQILFLTIYGEIPNDNRIENEKSFRERYLGVIDLYLDKAKFTLQKGVPIESGLDRNVKSIN